MTSINVNDIAKALSKLQDMSPEDIEELKGLLEGAGLGMKVVGKDDETPDLLKVLNFRNLMEAMKFYDTLGNICNRATKSYEKDADENGMLGDCRSRLEAIGCVVDHIMHDLGDRIHNDPGYEEAKEIYLMQENSHSSDNETRNKKKPQDFVMFG